MPTKENLYQSYLLSSLPVCTDLTCAVCAASIHCTKQIFSIVAYNALCWILKLNKQFHIVRTLHEKAALNARFDTFLFSYSWLCMMYTALARSTRSSACCLSWAANHKEADLKGEQLKQVSKHIQAAAGQQSNKEQCKSNVTVHVESELNDKKTPKTISYCSYVLRDMLKRYSRLICQRLLALHFI